MNSPQLRSVIVVLQFANLSAHLSLRIQVCTYAWLFTYSMEIRVLLSSNVVQRITCINKSRDLTLPGPIHKIYFICFILMIIQFSLLFTSHIMLEKKKEEKNTIEKEGRSGRKKKPKREKRLTGDIAQRIWSLKLLRGVPCH